MHIIYIHIYKNRFLKSKVAQLSEDPASSISATRGGGGGHEKEDTSGAGSGGGLREEGESRQEEVDAPQPAPVQVEKTDFFSSEPLKRKRWASTPPPWACVFQCVTVCYSVLQCVAMVLPLDLGHTPTSTLTHV